ncbi:MAG: cyclic nucleotide-binding domain-containing protein [Ilumatobacteraceae bacterium]|nr:cyclic nucleotide-binding domain-containing protein [Ilumatobacteraceae bacterium]
MTQVGGTAPTGDTGAVRQVLADPGLRRIVAAFGCFALAENATWLAVLVYAFERGGVREAGLVALLQLTPAVFVAPFAAFAGDRFRRDRVLQVGYLVQAGAMAWTATGMATGSVAVTYLGATLAAASVTFTRPVMGAILADVTRTPDTLVAATSVSTAVGEVGASLGPVLGGLVLALGSPGWVFGIASGLMLASALTVSRLHLYGRFGRRHLVEASDVIAEVFVGLRALGRNANVRVMVLLLAMALLVVGVLDVVGVTFADERLDAGGGVAGLLAGAVSVGAVAGAAAGAGLAAGGRTVRYLVASSVLVGAPLVVLASVDRLTPAVLLAALCGAGSGLLRVTATIAIQRYAPLDVITRIFGVVEGLQMAALALGSYGVSVLVGATSLGTALAVVGVGLTVVLLVGVRRFAASRPDDVLVDRALLGRLVVDPHLKHLPAPAIERVARSVERVEHPGGTLVIRQGDHGDRYYLVLDGELHVDIDGEVVNHLAAPKGFGSIALLRDVPRTANVRAVTDVELLAVPRADFLQAVIGRPVDLDEHGDPVEERR